MYTERVHDRQDHPAELDDDPVNLDQMPVLQENAAPGSLIGWISVSALLPEGDRSGGRTSLCALCPNRRRRTIEVHRIRLRLVM